jgi:hypothetical protein
MGGVGKALTDIGTTFATGGTNLLFGGGTGGLERMGQGVGSFLGVNPETKLKGAGQFKLTGEALEGEREALQRFRDIASGKIPSVSEMQFTKALQDLTKQQQSAAASARGVSNIGLIQREAMQAGKEAGLDIGQQSAIAKEQEMRNASDQLIRSAAAQRGVALEAAQSELSAQQRASQTRAEFFGRVAGAAGTAAASDVSMKENINQSEKSGSEMIKEFMDALQSYTYNYKDKENNGMKNPDGKVTSVMAQDLEKTQLGKQMVHDGPEGKIVDYGQGMAPLFAAIAELDKRTKKMEKKG